MEIEKLAEIIDANARMAFRWEHFIIRKLDDKTIDWSNCSFIKVFEEYVFD